MLSADVLALGKRAWLALPSRARWRSVRRSRVAQPVAGSSSAPYRELPPRYGIALPLQFGDLRAHQLQTVEHTEYPGAGVRRKRISECSPQYLQACATVLPEGLVV